MKKTKALVVSPIATHPTFHGNRQRILQMSHLLRISGFSVELAIGVNRKITPEAEAFWPVIHRLRASPPWRPTRRNVRLDSWYRQGLGEEVAELVRETAPDVVVMNYVFHSKLLEYLPDGPLKVIDTHDVFTERRILYRDNKYAGGFFSCSREDEVTYLRRADVIISISPEDTKHFKSLDASLNIVDLPFAPGGEAEVRGTSGKKPEAISRNSRHYVYGILMSANDLNLANLHSFIQSVDSIFGRNPPFRVRVAGDINRLAYQWIPHRSPVFLRDWIDYVGRVDRVASFYESVDATLVPVVEGSGMAIKFVEALAHRSPTFSTHRGSRGVNTFHRLHQLESNYHLVRSLEESNPDKVNDLIDAGGKLLSDLNERVECGRQALLAHTKRKVEGHS